MANSDLRNIPSVEKLASSEALAPLVALYGHELAVYAARQAVAAMRQQAPAAKTPPSFEAAVESAAAIIRRIAEPSLRPVLNATGILLHTNLGRAPLGEQVLNDIAPVVLGYCNLEYDLSTGRRGHRKEHVADLLRFVTGAQDVLAVNNNAAAIILVLHTLAKDREVIISRGELIEIGGAFRIPEIMAAGGARMVEVGTTNRTRLSDYERALTDRTALIFKAHKSNYAISGFTEEVGLADLAGFARGRGLPLVYDIGSGLLRKPANLPLDKEPDVAGSIADGADLVTFSCDKLLGGPQAGVIAGNAALVEQLEDAPLMRALRLDKIGIAALSSACRAYLTDQRLSAANPAFAMLSTAPETLKQRAEDLRAMMVARGVGCAVVESQGHCGGGTLPELVIPSYAVEVADPRCTGDPSGPQRLFHRMLAAPTPTVGILREGRFLLDVLTLWPAQLGLVAEQVCGAVARGAAP